MEIKSNENKNNRRIKKQPKIKIKKIKINSTKNRIKGEWKEKKIR